MGDHSIKPGSDAGIRIGTLVKRGMGSSAYIAEILPHGFESFQLSFWQQTRDIVWETLAEEVNRVLEGSDAVVSSISVFGNPMEDTELDRESRNSFRAAVEHAHRFGCDMVTGFTGRIRSKPIHESMEAYKRVWGDLSEYAANKSVRIAFENCDMGGTWQSGDWNIAHNPTAWEMMFDAIPAENIGLEWEPCHQMVSLIDPLPQIEQWGHKFFHVHGKDATIRWDVVRTYGVHSSVHADIAVEHGFSPIPAFAYHRTPGFGDSNWTDIISELRRVGYSGTIDIEGWHDPVYRDELEMTGQVHALNYLKRCRGGSFVNNPA